MTSCWGAWFKGYKGRREAPLVVMGKLPLQSNPNGSGFTARVGET